MADSLAILALLIGLELVLGVDNILVITIFVGRLPEAQRNQARIFGLALALVARIIMLFILLKLSNLTTAIILDFSIRDIILLAGGLFLLWKAVSEIHHTIELKEEHWHLRLLLMSCRVMSRGVGTVLMSHIMQECKKDGKKLLADFKQTKRNRMMFVSYKFANFKQISSDDEGNILFENDLAMIQPFPPYIDVKIF